MKQRLAANLRYLPTWGITVSERLSGWLQMRKYSGGSVSHERSLVAPSVRSDAVILINPNHIK